jgi:hypothetical protein
VRILVDTEMPNHWKVQRFARILGDPLAGWYLIRLWAWAFNQACDGDLSRFQPADIAMAVQYKGRPSRLIRVLLEVGLLDPDPLRIHDWETHNGHQRRWYDSEASRKRDERRRKKEAEEQRHAGIAARQGQQTPGIPGGVRPDVRADVPPDVPYSPPLPSPPDLPPPTPSRGEGGGLRSNGEGPEGGGGLPDGTWEAIWRELPNKRGYWERRARKELEAVLVVPEEVPLFLEWLNRKKHTRSWEQSPPTPPAVALEYIERRRKPARAADTPKRRATDPDRAQIRASWAGVAEAAAQVKRGGA